MSFHDRECLGCGLHFDAPHGSHFCSNACECKFKSTVQLPRAESIAIIEEKEKQEDIGNVCPARSHIEFLGFTHHRPIIKTFPHEPSKVYNKPIDDFHIIAFCKHCGSEYIYKK